MKRRSALRKMIGGILGGFAALFLPTKAVAKTKEKIFVTLDLNQAYRFSKRLETQVFNHEIDYYTVTWGQTFNEKLIMVVGWSGNGPYESYRKDVVNACVKLSGEQYRQFWDTQCSFEQEYAEGRDPAEVAQSQIDSL